MTAPRPTLPRRLGVGAVLVLLGLVSWALYGVAAGAENTSYQPQAAPPTYVRVEAGHTYWLAVPGGVQKLADAGVDAAEVSCTAAAAGEAPVALRVSPVVTAQNTETKFVNRIGSFVADASGSVHIECARIGAVYLDNPAGGGFDWSGLWLVLASAALAIGLPLTLSGLRRPPVRPRVDASAGYPAGE